MERFGHPALGPSQSVGRNSAEESDASNAQFPGLWLRELVAADVSEVLLPSSARSERGTSATGVALPIRRVLIVIVESHETKATLKGASEEARS